MNKLFYVGPSFAELHEQYAKKGRIDENAGSVAYDNIDINADAETVWNILYNIAAWPKFNPLVSAVNLPQGVAVDESGSLKIKGFPINLTFAVVDPYSQLVWTGRSLWTKAIDQFIIEPIGKSTVRLHLNESLAGVFVPLMSSSAQLHNQHHESLASIKRQAESKLTATGR